MKSQSKLLIALLAASLAAAPMIHAQSAPDHKPAREQGPGGPGGRGGPNLDMLAQELGLSADQKAKLAPILEQQRAKMQELRDLAPEQRREKMRAVREENHKALAAILTPEQLKKFDEMNRGPRGGGAPKGEKKGDK
jgi:Spy/CpxP family protein refolding chaperone